MREKEYEDLYGLQACLESVEFSVEFLHQDPLTELGRAIVRAEQDVFFNRTMIDAWKQYIRDHGIRWER